MTSDDILSYLANLPKRNRPTELKSDSKILSSWIWCRQSKQFYMDVIARHGLINVLPSDFLLSIYSHEHAISNAWGWMVESILEGGIP